MLSQGHSFQYHNGSARQKNASFLVEAAGDVFSDGMDLPHGGTGKNTIMKYVSQVVSWQHC